MSLTIEDAITNLEKKGKMNKKAQEVKEINRKTAYVQGCIDAIDKIILKESGP